MATCGRGFMLYWLTQLHPIYVAMYLGQRRLVSRKNANIKTETTQACTTGSTNIDATEMSA